MNKNEQEELDEKWPENVSYTVNHAIACTASDLLSPFIGNFTQKYLGKRIEVGCRHEHHASPPPTNIAARSDAPNTDKKPITQPKSSSPTNKKGLFTRLSDKQGKHKETPYESEGRYQRFKLTAHDNCTRECSHSTVITPPSHLKHWWIGELAGDFGAVPLTIGISYWMPGAMNGVRHVVEPILSRFFHAGSRRAARQWAQDNGVSDNTVIDQKEQTIYEREMSHIPQAVVWTATSTALNISTQRLCGNNAPLSHLLTGKLVGSATSAALVVGFRGFFPHQAHRWDQYTTKRLFEPIAHAVHGKADAPRWQEKVRPENSQKVRQI